MSIFIRGLKKRVSGAVSFEAVFVIGLSAITLFVLFPPILQKLNTGDTAARGKAAIVSAMQEKSGVTYINNGTVYLASGDVVLHAIQAHARTLAQQASPSVDAVEGILKYGSCTQGVAANPDIDPACGANCCQKYIGSSQAFASCVAADVTDIKNTATTYPHCSESNPYVQPMILSLNGTKIAEGNGSTDNIPISDMVGTYPFVTGSGGGPSGGGASSMYWGAVTTEFARSGSTTRCPLRAEDPQICCGVTENGTFDLNSCGQCTQADILACSTRG